MRLRFITWLLISVLAAACAAGQPPPPPTRPALTAGASVPSAAAPTAGVDLAPATAPPGTASVAPTLSPTPTLTATTGLITSANAISLTEVAVIATGKVDQVAWTPDGTRLATAGAGGVALYNAFTLSATQSITVGQWATSLAFDPAGRDLAVGTVGAIVQV